MNRQHKIGIHCLISGKVQGVFYRANALGEAQILGLHGWVHNLPDGKVEVKAFGYPDDIEKFKIWLAHGTKQSQISDFFCEEIPLEHLREFSIR